MQKSRKVTDANGDLWIEISDQGATKIGWGSYESREYPTSYEAKAALETLRNLIGAMQEEIAVEKLNRKVRQNANDDGNVRAPFD